MAENYFLGWSIDLVRNADWISIWAGRADLKGYFLQYAGLNWVI